MVLKTIYMPTTYVDEIGVVIDKKTLKKQTIKKYEKSI